MRTLLAVLAVAGMLAAEPMVFTEENTPTYQATVINATPTGQEDMNGACGVAAFDASIPDPGATASLQHPRSADFEALTSPVDWGGDIPVGEMATMQGGRMSTDHAANGDIYCAQYTPVGAPQCSVQVFRSTDNGLTWGYWGGIMNSAGDDTLKDAVMRVGPGDNPWIYILCHYATADGALKLFRSRADWSDYAFYNIIRGDSVIGQIDLDRNIENPHSLFMTYPELNSAGSLIRLFASYDSGATWTGGRNVHSGDIKEPRVCAGAGGYVYVIYNIGDTEIRTGRYTNNLVSPSYQFTSVDTTGGVDGCYQPTVAASRMSTGSSQVAWILNRHYHTASDAYDVHVSWTTDGAQTWQTAYWTACGGIAHTPEDFRVPYLRVSYDYSIDLVSGVATLYTTPESLVHAWAPADDPNTWDRAVINEQRVTGQHAAGLDITPGTGGSIVTWRGYGSGLLWADYWQNLTGIEDGQPAPAGPALVVAPNPSRGAARISYSVPAAGPVSITIHDITGREIVRLASDNAAAGHYAVTWNRGSAPAGIYVCRMSCGGKTVASRTIVAE